MKNSHNKTKKILYIESNIDGTIGGSYFSLLLLIKYLNRNKYSPTVIFYRKNELYNDFIESGCKVVLFDKAKPLDFATSIGLFSQKIPLLSGLIKFLLSIPQKIINYFLGFIIPAIRCHRLLHREKIDLIHLNNTLKRPPEWILASLFSNAKIIAHERGINTSFSLMEKFWAQFLDTIICISGAVKENLVKHGFHETKLFLVYNGLDPNKFIVSKEKKVVLKDLHIAESDSVIGVVGNIKQWKGQETIVRAMIHIRKVLPNVRCLLIGDAYYNGGYFSRLKSIIRANKLDDCILLTGHRNDIPDVINTLSVLIHTSVFPEPFGRVLLEGMALRKPIVTTNIGAGPEIVQDEETGKIVAPGDDKELANAIVDLLNDHDKAKQMGEAGRKRLEKCFHIDETARKIDELYGKILQ